MVRLALLSPAAVVAACLLPCLATPALASVGSICPQNSPVAPHGAPLQGGGFLAPSAFFTPSTLNEAGRIAFVSPVQGSARNQGVFAVDPSGLITEIARGAGGGGGSGTSGGGAGDPTPLGGTFTGFFTGTLGVPAQNDAGDVLFLADVENGTSSRGLFVHQAATQQIVAVAWVGASGPLGPLARVGPGVLAENGDALFLATHLPGGDSDVYRWSQGTLSVVVRRGDPAPGGGVFQLLGTEAYGFQDGTTIPGGPLPSIDEAGRIAFRGILSGGQQGRGLFLIEGGTTSWIVGDQDVPPQGGKFFDFQAPILNDLGEVAFFADYQPSPGNFNAGWFAGRAGEIRNVLSFFDPLPGGGICFGLAFSRGPMKPIDDLGTVVVWTDAQLPSGAMQERLVLVTRNGAAENVVCLGDAAPSGGSIGTMSAWPSLNDAGDVAFGAATPGGPLSVHFLREESTPWQNQGFALAGALGAPLFLGSGLPAPGNAVQLELTNAAPVAPGFLIVGAQPGFLPLLSGTLVPGLPVITLPIATDPAGAWTAVAPWPAGIPSCVDVYMQFWIADASGPAGATASNGLRMRTR